MNNKLNEIGHLGWKTNRSRCASYVEGAGKQQPLRSEEMYTMKKVLLSLFVILALGVAISPAQAQDHHEVHHHVVHHRVTHHRVVHHDDHHR